MAGRVVMRAPACSVEESRRSYIAQMSGDTYAVVTDYDGLVAAPHQRAIELDTTYDVVDHVSGMTMGWVSKTIGASPIKRLGLQSLGALGLKIALVVDEEAFAKIRPRLSRRAGRTKVLWMGHFYALAR
jgi:hypothetical protein